MHGAAGYVFRPISPAVHGMWRDVSARLRPCRAVCSARLQNVQGAIESPVIIGSSPIAERVPLISFPAIPVSGVADDAGRYGTRESVPRAADNPVSQPQAP